MFTPTHQRRRPMLFRTVKNRVLTMPVPGDRALVGDLALQVANLVGPVLPDNVHGWRRQHSVLTAVHHIESVPGRRMAFDIKDYFSSIDQRRLRRQLDRLDCTLWPRLQRWLPQAGLPQGCAFSPTLANLYLAEMDRRYPNWVRYADNIVVIGNDPERLFSRIQRQLGDIGLSCHEVVLDPDVFCKQPLRPRSRPHL